MKSIAREFLSKNLKAMSTVSSEIYINKKMNGKVLQSAKEQIPIDVTMTLLYKWLVSSWLSHTALYVHLSSCSISPEPTRRVAAAFQYLQLLTVFDSCSSPFQNMAYSWNILRCYEQRMYVCLTRWCQPQLLLWSSVICLKAIIATNTALCSHRAVANNRLRSLWKALQVQVSIATLRVQRSSPHTYTSYHPFIFSYF